MSGLRQSAIDRHMGTRLTALRLASHLDEADFAGKLGISLQQLRMFEAGEKRFPPATLIKTAHLFGVSIGYFFEDAPLSGADLALSGVTADLLRFLSLPQAYPLIRAFIAIKGHPERDAIVAHVQAASTKPQGSRLDSKGHVH